VAACDGRAELPSPDSLGVERIELALPVCAPAARPLRVDTVATGLEVPWDVAFVSDGRALVTERPGRIRVVSAEGQLLEEPWATLDVYGPPGSEVGLLGIDTREESGDSLEVYVSATVQRAGGSSAARLLRGIVRRIARAIDPERGQAITLQVVRLVEREGRGADATPVVSGLPSASLHGGGPLRFGPDGFLYVANGDGTDPPSAQRAGSLRGKILRYAPDGSVPRSNPTPTSPVFASGVRHVQGLGWLPGTGELLAIDHGPTGLAVEGGRTDQDELDVVDPGANLGWPIVSGATRGGPLVSPIVVWTPALAPAGLAVYGHGGSAWQRSVFVTGLRGASLRRIALERTATGPVAVCEEILFANEYGRLRLVRAAPDGTLWVGTSNRDGRGVPRPSDDLVLRVHPPQS
jgi:glucose/arabinose dehydrogenase